MQLIAMALLTRFLVPNASIGRMLRTNSRKVEEQRNLVDKREKRRKKIFHSITDSMALPSPLLCC